MLLKMYSCLRNDEARFREFAEPDDLDIDRRLGFIREFALSDEEIAAVLRENDAEGIRLIAAQIHAAGESVGLAEAFKITALRPCEKDFQKIIDRVTENINDWAKYLRDNNAWPGRPGPLAERVYPVFIEPDASGRPLTLTLHGWLFNPDVNIFGVVFSPAGSLTTKNDIQAVVKKIDANGVGSTAIVEAKLPAGIYDVIITQNTPDATYPKGSSRLPMAITVAKFTIKSPP